MTDVWVPGWTMRRFTDPKSFLPNANMVACAHTQVGSYEGSWSWGNRDGNPYAHSYLRGSGEGVNAWPVNLKGAANLEGNPYVWAIESEDVNPLYFPSWSLKCGDVPPWTDAQEQTLAEGLAWWCLRHSRPPVLIPDCKPGRVGLAYHRIGVPGSPEWVTGADQWTKYPGKCCPDWRRIHQFKTEVVPAVAAIVNGGDDDPMGFYNTRTDFENAVRDMCRRAVADVTIGTNGADQQLDRRDFYEHVERVKQLVADLAGRGDTPRLLALRVQGRKGANDAASGTRVENGTTVSMELQTKLDKIQQAVDDLAAAVTPPA